MEIQEYFWAGVAMGIGLQLHYLLFLFPVAALWIMVHRKAQEKMKGTMLGHRLLLGYAPFLLFELRHGFQYPVDFPICTHRQRYWIGE